MDTNNVLLLAGLGVVSFFASKLLLKVDQGVEDKKLRALQISQWAGVNGLPLVSGLLQSFAINDVSGVVGSIRQIADVISDPVQSQDVLKRFVTIQLDKQLSTTDGKAELIAWVEKRLGIKLTATPAPTEVK